MQVKPVLKSEAPAANPARATGNVAEQAGRDERWLQQVKQEYSGSLPLKSEEGPGPRMTAPGQAAAPMADAKEASGQAQASQATPPATANGAASAGPPAAGPNQPAQRGESAPFICWAGPLVIVARHSSDSGA